MAVLEEASAIPGRGVVRLGGAGKVAADLIAKHIDAEVRVTVLGHVQRGGGPTATDRLLATRFGCRVMDLVNEGRWDHMVGLHGSEIVPVPLSQTTKARKVDPNGELVRFARSLGTSFGAE